MAARIESGIYRIRNTVNGKVYVGSAVDVAKRWIVHRHHLSKRTHHCRHLQHAWVKHGEAAFVFEIIEAVPVKKGLIAREQAYIDSLSAADRLHGYNVAIRAGSVLGVRRSAEFRAKVSLSAKGNTRWLRRKHSDTSRAKISVGAKGNTRWLGRKHSEAARAKQLAQQGSPEARARKAQSATGNTNWVGRKHSEATKAKLSLRMMGNSYGRGRTVSDETRAKLSRANKGRNNRTGTRHSDETKNRMSLAQKKRREEERIARERRNATRTG
jgi:group I intron endonuclease